MALRVAECGKSECSSVMEGIEVATSPHAKAGRLPPVSLHEKVDEPTKEATQMTAITPTAVDVGTGAASHTEIDWHSINWEQVNQTVRRLQTRIVKATHQG